MRLALYYRHFREERHARMPGIYDDDAKQRVEKNARKLPPKQTCVKVFSEKFGAISATGTCSEDMTPLSFSHNSNARAVHTREMVVT